MKTNPFPTEMPVTRVSMILPYTRLLHSVGAPVDRLLNRARISPELLNHPSAVLPLVNAFRFCELACQTEGTEHLGFLVGLSTTLGDYGPYGKILQNALTVYDYLQKGISLYNMMVTGQRLLLSEHGEEFRLTIESNVESGIGTYQSHLETLITTIERLRDAAGPDWSPTEISLAHRAQENIPDTDLLGGSRIIQGAGETFLTIPGAIMGERFPDSGSIVDIDMAVSHERSLPEDLAGVVKYQVESLSSDSPVRIDTVAESLALNPRSLQHMLARKGQTYSRLYSEIRMKKAAEWLENTDKPIAEIASDLGYRDASNFTRAFKRQTGVSPRAYRNHSKYA
ncbi:MAG: helix-turn-helix domain-containing protein [Rhodothermales bacterium]